MPPRNTAERMRVVEQAIEDHIADTRKLPSTTDVISSVTLGDRAVRETLDLLVKEGRIKPVYEAPKNPTIYMPAYMYDAVLRQQKRPPWVDTYEFEEARQIHDRIRESEDRLTALKRILDLLYSSGRTLEEAVAEALRVLEVDQLELPYVDPTMWDVSFAHDGRVYIADVKGKSKWADKADVGQLQMWMRQYVDMHPDADPEGVRGLLIINHFKDLDPVGRWPDDPDHPPISTAAEKYLLLGDARFLTTYDLFKLTHDVLVGEIDQAEGRRRLGDCLRRKVNDGEG